MAYMLMAQMMRERVLNLEKKHGLPQPFQGVMLAPFDTLADGYRGLQGIMIDLFERPDKVLEACDALIPDSVSCAIATASPLKHYPIFMPLHRGNHPFLSPKQFDTFYWPSLFKAIMLLIEAGYTVRAYLEGDWTPNWHHWNEFPRGKIICDIDNKADISRAKKEIGNNVCLAGGIPDQMFILGTPEEIRSRVKELCETVGRDGGLILNGGCGIPYSTKPENFRAYVNATLEYGKYSDTIKPKLKKAPPPLVGKIPSRRVITPWEVKLREFGGVMGDETLIKEAWETFEQRAFCWLRFWDW
jgi:uroporphyrinogen-III decarboxylase